LKKPENLKILEMESKAKCKEFPEIRKDFNMMVTEL